MILSVSVSINVWLLTVVVARFFLPCLRPIAWSLLLTLFIASLLTTVAIHMYYWKCWRYLRHDPQRLRSFTAETSKRNVRVGVVLFIWLEATTFVLLTWLCWQELNPLVFLVIVPAAFGTYTASICPFTSSEPVPSEPVPSEPLSSNVNTSPTSSTDSCCSSSTGSC